MVALQRMTDANIDSHGLTLSPKSGWPTSYSSFHAGASKQTGLTYWMVLVMVALSSLASAALLQIIATQAVREREAHLLRVGQAVKTAIGLYYERSPGGERTYPLALQDLLRDARFIGYERYLRRIYPDPITGQTQWGVIRNAQGAIIGVHSLSEDTPLKQAQFPAGLASFAQSSSYRDWQFIYRPYAP